MCAVNMHYNFIPNVLDIDLKPLSHGPLILEVGRLESRLFAFTQTV